MNKRFILCLSLLLAPITAAAQVANNTSMVGTVTDSTGSVLVGAHVVAVNRDTKVPYDATSNGEGYYSITGQINPGTYDISVEQSGFQKEIKTGVIVTLNQASRTDFALKVGSTTTEVTISADTPAIQTDDALLGETVTQHEVEDLPMNGRNALDLANIASNVTVSTGSALTGVPPGKTASGAGTRGVNNSITLDGITVMNNLGSTVTVQPNPDALASVQTQNGNYTAQYGNYLGIHIDQATRSGTNILHGTVYDYLQNDAVNSRGFNHTSAVVPRKAELRYNLFGAVVSGPVVIPHFYNGRDKTFFMGSYEGLRTKTVTPTYSQAFTTAEANGDFSALLNPAVSGAKLPVLIFSPFDGHPYATSSTSQIINDQPAANAPIVKNILSYAAPANVPGALLTANNLASTGSMTSEDSSVDRIDQTIGQKIRLFGRYDWQQVTGTSIAREYVNNNYNPTKARNAAAGVTYLITPNLANDLRGGFNWLKTSSLDYFYQTGPKNADALLGLPAPFGIGQANNDPGLPDITGGTSFSENESGDNWIQDDRTYQLYDQISWTKGKHSIMAGADIRRLNIGRAAVNSSRGVLNFASSYTNFIRPSDIPVSICPNTNNVPMDATRTHYTTTAPNSCAYGSADASLILGVLQQAQTPLFQVKEEVTQWRDGFFLQDNWLVSKQLTVQYGVRYELPQVPTSANGFARLMDPTYTFLVPPTPATSPTDYTPNPGLVLTGPNHKDIAPRLGFSYRVNDKITVRGGGGIYYNANQLNAYTLTSSNFPFASSVQYPSPANGAATSSNPYVTLSNPTAGAGAHPIAGVPGTYVSAYSVANPLPSETMYQWNLDNGLELWRNAGIEFQYLGSHSIHLNTNLYPNQPIAGVGNQTTTVNARRPNQNFGQIRVADNIANASYNGLTTVFRQRLNHGVSGSLSYTWSHALDESADANGGGGCMIQFNCKADWGNANADVRHKAVLAFTWALPVLDRHNFAMRETLGGWQLNGIVTVQTGTPFNVTLGSTDWANTGIPAVQQRPNFVHQSKFTCTKASILQEAYGTNNTSCVDQTAYTAPARFTYGNMHRNDAYGPGLWTNNLSLFKNFKIKERLTFQFRMEAFNALNHTNLGNPGNITLNVTSQSTTVGTPGYTVGTLSPASATAGFGNPAVTGAGRTLQFAGKINF